jgi:glycosyltransferase involved in cell wall biosynthesis
MKAVETDGTPRPKMLFLITAEISRIFLRGQLTYMVERGFDVHIGTRFDTWPPENMDRMVVAHNVPFVRHPSLVADLRALWQTWLLVGKLRPAIVHAGTPKASLLGMLASRLRRVPVRVYSIHGLRYETSTGIMRRILVATERVTCACATHVIADSSSIRRRALADRLTTADKVVVVGSGSANGVDTTRFASLPNATVSRRLLGCQPNNVIVGFVGRLTRDKGINDLVDVFQRLIEVIPTARLLLVGPLEESDSVEPRTAEAINNSPMITHVAWMDDVRVAYACMDVCAFPSYREGLPNVPLEAQSAGVPIVAYAATGTLDAIHPEGVLVPVGDRAALQAELETMLSDTARSAYLGSAAQGWVRQEFDQGVVWPLRADFFARAYCDVLQATTRTSRIGRTVSKLRRRAR